MANKFALAGPGSKYKENDAKPAGFWAGYWHGMIMPIAFIVSLFNPDVGIYETHNTGKGYNFGFVLGGASSLGSKVNVNPPSDEDQDEIEDEDSDE